MSIELQIQSSIFGSIIASAVQSRLWAACFPVFGAGYVDHADLGSAPVELIAINSAVHLRVPLDVFLVSRKAVLAAPNAVPSQVMASASTIFLVLEIVVTGAVVSLVCVAPDLGSLGAKLGPDAQAAKDAICEIMGSLGTLDLTKPLQQLGMPTVKSSRVELIGNVIAIRFEPAGIAANHLFLGQEWGVFLDGASVEQLAMSKAPKNLISQIALQAQWKPEGDKPHVDISGSETITLGAISADVNVGLSSDFSLTPTITKLLRTTVNWSFHVNLGALVPGFIDNWVENMVSERIESTMNPTAFGATPTGDHSFVIDNPLPEVSLGGTRFGYSSVFASTTGMTIGGQVRLPLDLGRDTVQLSLEEFGLPFRLSFCRTLAKSGSGVPSKTVSLSEVTTTGRIHFEKLGAFCSFEIISPGSWIDPYIRVSANIPEITIVIPSALALGIVEDVRLIVRTARGVRLVDFRSPPPVRVDANGNVINAQTSYIPNCLYKRLDHSISWGTDDSSLTTLPEQPNWSAYLRQHRGIDVQLVALSGLEPGELIQFRSRSHAVDITAGPNGRALVPVLLPVTNNLEEASLIRVNRRNITGHFYSYTAIFMNQANVPAGTQHRFYTSADGIATVTTKFDDHTDVYEIGLIGVPILSKREQPRAKESRENVARVPLRHSCTCSGGKSLRQSASHKAIHSLVSRSYEETALNPQPLPPREVVFPADKFLFTQRINIPGIKSLVPIPGFPDAAIAIASMVDGSMLVLDLMEDGTVRVAGTFTGPIGILDESGDWAVAVDSDRIYIYRVTHDLG